MSGEMASSRRFVQFPHPGSEHRPDSEGGKRWNTLDRDHARKFLQLDGAWTNRHSLTSGRLWAWGEWEPESELIRHLHQTSPTYPRYLWHPYWIRKESYVGLHNTDPFIFGDSFYYTDCKQAESPSLEGLRHLDVGSVIVFGSAKKPYWVLDTVLVVSDFRDHDRHDYRERLVGMVPDCYEDVTLRPTYQNPEKSARRLYVGATHNAPVDGMFSFFPCMPAGDDAGFQRPMIELPEQYFNRGLLQGAKRHGRNNPPALRDKLQELWESIVGQVLEQGLMLGVAASVPEERPRAVGVGRTDSPSHLHGERR